MLLAGVCCLYSGAAWVERREPHLLWNAALYGVLTAYERHMVSKHRGPC
jgi:hypothetical protein